MCEENAEKTARELWPSARVQGCTAAVKKIEAKWQFPNGISEMCLERESGKEGNTMEQRIRTSTID